MTSRRIVALGDDLRNGFRHSANAANARRLVLAVLQRSYLQSFRAGGDRAVCNSAGTGRVKRRSAAIGALLEVRPQRRDDG
jgi:hypothetical protein